MILYCKDARGLGCKWSGQPTELVATKADTRPVHCPNCGGSHLEETGDNWPEPVEPEGEHDGYDVGGES